MRCPVPTSGEARDVTSIKKKPTPVTLDLTIEGRLSTIIGYPDFLMLVVHLSCKK
jgi:hypothetical protein